jgi:hypothetical protein
MSCSNLTSGIAKGCNDQVGGITGIHYTRWYDELLFEKDANGVVVRVGFDNPPRNLLWYWVEADNGLGNLTETYNVGGTGNILGFNQSLNFFIPTTATPSVNQPTNTLQNWVRTQAAQNNILIGVELEHHSPLMDYASKALLFGQERPAYTNSGNKQTGVAYGDNNGYTIEWAANSKEPMNQIAYMALHSYQLRCERPNSSTDFYDGSYWNLEPLERFEGANVRQLGQTGLYPEYYVMPGELLTIQAQVTMDWSANCFTGSTFTPTMEIYIAQDPSGTQTSQPLNYLNLPLNPLPTAPGVNVVDVKGTYENTSNNPVGVFPCRITSNQDPNVSMNTAPFVPEIKFITITRTTRS